jgi:hypothetical protein
MNRIYKEWTKLTVSAQEATQTMKTFSETLKAIQERYNPIVWWIIKVFKL